MKSTRLMCLIVVMFAMLLFSCNNTTVVKKGEIVGRVTLDGQNEHAGVLVSIFKADVVPQEITDIRKDYARLGFSLSDREFFDHREHVALERVYTRQDGSFSFSKLPYDKYIISYSKEGWGYNYLFEMELNQKEYDLTGVDLVLYPEIVLPNYIDQCYVFEEDRTYVANANVAVAETGSLKFENNSKLLLADDSIVSVYGGLECPEIGFAHISANHGVYGEDISTVICSEGVRAFGDNHVFRNLRFSHLRKALDVTGENNNFDSLLINNCDIGLIVSNSDDIELRNSIFVCSGEVESGSANVYHSNVVSVVDNIFLNNTIGLRNELVKECLIANNAFLENNKGFQNLWESETLLQHNYINSHGIGIENSGKSNLEILRNDIHAKVCIKTYHTLNWYNTVTNGWTKSNYNNFNATLYAVESRARYYCSEEQYPLDFKNNYWHVTSAAKIDELIIDYHDLDTEVTTTVFSVVEYVPFRQSKVSDAGIE